MKALILSAGIGKRMQPITDYVPKPLLPIANQTLIEVQIRHLSKQGVDHFGINLHHHAPVIEKELRKFDNIEIAVENKILGTGGVLVNFKNWNDGDFYVQACDMLSDPLISDLRQQHEKKGFIATLALIKTGSAADSIETNKHKELVAIKDQPAQNQYTYAGAAMYTPEIFSMLPDRPVFSVVDLWNNALKKGKKINTMIIRHKWFNVNTPESYLNTVAQVLHNNFPIISQKFKDQMYVHNSSRVNARVMGFASIGKNCVIEKPVFLKNVIVLDNTHLKTGNYENAIVSDCFQYSCQP